MFVIIAGAGKIGQYLASMLLLEGHKIVLIEKNKEAFEKASTEFGEAAVLGDATDPKVLEKTNIKEADAFVALTGEQKTNLVLSLLAKELGAKKVATRLSQMDYDEKTLEKLGIDTVVHPEAAAAGYVAEILTQTKNQEKAEEKK